MHRREWDVLFSEYDLGGILDNQLRSINDRVWAIPKGRFDSDSDEQIAAAVASELAIESLELSEAEVSVESEDVKVDVRNDFSRAVVDRSRPAYYRWNRNYVPSFVLGRYRSVEVPRKPVHVQPAERWWAEKSYYTPTRLPDEKSPPRRDSSKRTSASCANGYRGSTDRLRRGLSLDLPSDSLGYREDPTSRATRTCGSRSLLLKAADWIAPYFAVGCPPFPSPSAVAIL